MIKEDRLKESVCFFSGVWNRKISVSQDFSVFFFSGNNSFFLALIFTNKSNRMNIDQKNSKFQNAGSFFV